MMGIFDAPDNRSFLGVLSKKLSDEDKAKADAAAERKKKVETFVSFQEKLDDIKRLQAEIQVAKINAAQASPGVFGVGGIGSPGLNLGPEGLAGLAQRGGAELATTQARLAKWLTGIDPLEMQTMSQERQLMVKQYMQMEQYLRAVMRDNQMLQQELAYTQSVAQRPYYSPNDGYDDGSDPAWEELQRRRAAGHPAQHHPLQHPQAPHPHHNHNAHFATTHHAHVHQPPQQFTHTHVHAPTTHVHATTCTPFCAPVQSACSDPHCAGSCGFGCAPIAPPPQPVHHHHHAPAPTHHHHHAQQHAHAPAHNHLHPHGQGGHHHTVYDPPLSPGFARARAAANEYSLFNRQPGFY